MRHIDAVVCRCKTAVADEAFVHGWRVGQHSVDLNLNKQTSKETNNQQLGQLKGQCLILGSHSCCYTFAGI